MLAATHTHTQNTKTLKHHEPGPFFMISAAMALALAGTLYAEAAKCLSFGYVTL